MGAQVTTNRSRGSASAGYINHRGARGRAQTDKDTVERAPQLQRDPYRRHGRYPYAPPRHPNIGVHSGNLTDGQYIGESAKGMLDFG